MSAGVCFFFFVSLHALPRGASPSRLATTPFKVARHVLTTVAIMALSLYCALSVPGVGVVWSICGSSVSYTAYKCCTSEEESRT